MKRRRFMAVLLILALALALALPVSAGEYPELSGNAEIKDIQKYGNVTLSLTQEELFAAGYAYGDLLTVRFLEHTLDLPLCSNYSDVDSGEPGVFARDEDLLVRVAINMGDFATTYGLAVKTTYEDKSYVWNWAEGVAGPVRFTLTMKEPGGYRNEYLLHQLSYTDDRADYPGLSDAEFANFRAVKTTGMGSGILYRTASPVNPAHNRSAIADDAIRAAGVTVVMNLADEEAAVRSYEGFDESYYATTSFIALNMGVDFAAAEFREKLAEGLRFFAEHPGVYAVHCTEGKDRAGFVAALLECLMGASYQEVAEDYMISFFNYYGVTPDDLRYDAILSSGMIRSLSRAFGVSDLENADLSACAEAYLLDCGLSAESLAALRENLSVSRELAGSADAGEGILTRGEFVAALFLLSGTEKTEPDQADFTDVSPRSELASAVRWAVDGGIVMGYGNGRFGPGDPVTREQMAAMLYRYAGALGWTPEDEGSYPLEFPDADEISAYAKQAVSWAALNGILSDAGAGIKPKAAVTDGELPAILDHWRNALGEDRAA